MTNRYESVRVVWSATDEQFFRISAELFPAEFLRGASALLGSYDPEPAEPDHGPGVPAHSPAPTARTAAPRRVPT